MESGKSEACEVKSADDSVVSEEEITMGEYLEEQEKLEKDANVVLGGSDSTNCTYLQVRLIPDAILDMIVCAPSN